MALSGNFGNDKDDEGNLRRNIDTSPGIFEGYDYPLIVVGAVDFDGKTASFSQGGDHLTITAGGVNVKMQNRDNDNEAADSGTSFGKS